MVAVKYGASSMRTASPNANESSSESTSAQKSPNAGQRETGAAST
jgi:hypothetical protein